MNVNKLINSYIGANFLAVILVALSSLMLSMPPTVYAMNPYAKNAGDSLKKLPAAKKGGTFYYQLQGNPRVLIPILTGDVASTNVIGNMYAPLMAADPETMEYFPVLAEKYDVTPDYKVMTLTLRKDATWEDGNPITADDAEFTWKVLMDPKVDAAPLRSYFEGITFEKVDDHTIKFKVEKPNINTAGIIFGLFQILSKKQFEHEKDFNKSKGVFSPIGSGPYKLKSYSRDQKLELELKKDWWGFKIPALKNVNNFETIVYRIIPDTALAYEKFIKGEIDAIEMNAEMYGTRVMGVDKDKFGKAAGTSKSVWAANNRTSAPAPYTYIGWNLKKPLFSSKKTRQALAMLIDYDQVNDKIYYGTYARSYSPFGSLTANTAPDQKSKAFKLNPKKALELLKEDGWADTDGDNVLDKTINGKKVKFEFTIRYNSENPMRAKIAQMVREQFKKAGIQVNVVAMEWNAYVSQIDTRDFDAIIMGWGKGSVHPNAKQIWHSSSYANKGSNFGGYSNPEADKLIDQAESELNAKKRNKIMQKLGAIIYDDQPYVFLVELPGFMAGYQSRLKSGKWLMKYDDTVAIDRMMAP